MFNAPKVMIAVLLAPLSFAAAQDAGKPAAEKPAQPAAPPPPAEEIKRVLDYYYTGKDRGPALVELKACLKVDVAKDSPTKSECVEPVKGPVKKNTVVHAWALLVQVIVLGVTSGLHAPTLAAVTEGAVLCSVSAHGAPR